MGLPEVDDRYHIWRVPLCNEQGGKIGEAVIDAYTTELLASRTTKPELIEARLLKKPEEASKEKKPVREYTLSPLRTFELSRHVSMQAISGFGLR